MSLNYQICNFLWNQSWFKPEYGRFIYKKICQEAEAPDAPFVKDFFGLKYEGNLQNTIEFSIFYLGAFEKPLLFFLRDCLQAMNRSPATFCDIGANIGQHSLFMSRIADTVHSFEPYQPVRDKLLHQISLNDLNNLTVHPVGLSDTNQSLPFFAPTGRNQGIGSFDASTVSKGNRNIGKLALVAADEYMKNNNINSIDLMKIDVEGFEKSVLSGLKSTMTRYRPIVVCEITYAKELSIKSLEELTGLFPEGYRFYTFDTRKADGSKARRRGARAKRTGSYRLIPFQFDHPKGQDDIIACPQELLNVLPMHNSA
ncbi:MAG: FkbM family methyltransferase [Gammaproteobacteria bacterium]|nr:FkbM family methyltransferase [Gammaproteobacteria bacterium]